MPIFTTSGSKVFIGGVKNAQSTDFIASDFTSESWVEITSLESIGKFGDTSVETTFDDIGAARTKKLKGNRNAGNLEMVVGIDYSDAGQLALLAAEKTPYDYAFKVEFNDKPSGSSPTNSTRLFVGKVMMAEEVLDTANNVMKLNGTLSVNSNIVRVAPTTGDE